MELQLGCPPERGQINCSASLTMTAVLRGSGPRQRTALLLPPVAPTARRTIQNTHSEPLRCVSPKLSASPKALGARHAPFLVADWSLSQAASGKSWEKENRGNSDQFPLHRERNHTEKTGSMKLDSSLCKLVKSVISTHIVRPRTADDVVQRRVRLDLLVRDRSDA